jgi:hypothetical protein
MGGAQHRRAPVAANLRASHDMSRNPINPHGFDEYRLAHETKQKPVDRILEYQADTRQRVDTLVKAIFVLSGGALTISIGIFLRTGAQQLSADLAQLLQKSWWLLFYSLAACATVFFLMICQGYRLAALWEDAFNSGDNEIAASRLLQAMRIINWSLGVTGFLSFIVGLALLAYVSVVTVAAIPDLSRQGGRPQVGAPDAKR